MDVNSHFLIRKVLTECNQKNQTLVVGAKHFKKIRKIVGVLEIISRSLGIPQYTDCWFST